MKTETALLETIIELSDALESASKALGQGADKLNALLAKVEDIDGEDAPEPKPAPKKKAAAKTKAAPQPAPEPEETDEVVDLAATQALALQYVQEHGVAAAREILKPFNARKVSEADPESLPDIHAAFKDALS